MTEPVGLNTNALNSVSMTNESGAAGKTAANPELGQVKKPSGWAIFGRVVLGIVTLGISEGIRAIVKSCKSKAPSEPRMNQNETTQLRARARKETFETIFTRYKGKPGLSDFDIKSFAEPLGLGASRYIKNAMEHDGANFNFDTRFGEYKKLSDDAAEFFSRKPLFDIPLRRYMESGNVTGDGLNRVMEMLSDLENKVNDRLISQPEARRISNTLVDDLGVINEAEYKTVMGQ